MTAPAGGRGRRVRGIGKPPKMCLGCGVARVAWTDPRVDYCYSCLPGGPFTAPRCACGSKDYFCQGMCGRCHPGAPGYLDSCRDCQAWGVLRRHNWLCWSCRGWRRRYPVGQCPYCARTLPLGEMGACRGCYQQAFHFRDPGAPLDLLRANRFGRQLYLANLHLSRIRSGRRTGTPAPATTGGQGFEPVAQVQLALFDLAPDLHTLSAAQPREPAMAEHCERILVEHAARHGWSARTVRAVRRAVTVLQSLQATPGARIQASSLQVLAQRGLPQESTLEVLQAAGLLEDDRVPPLRRYFLARTAGLPAPMTEQLELWYSIMTDGSPRPPRRLPRESRTVELHIRRLAPVLETWAGEGCTTLAEITAAQVRAALAQADDKANLTPALKGLFAILKGRRKIFTNPAVRVPGTPTRTNLPLLTDTDTVRAALNHPDPATALAVALVVFHALTAVQIRDLQLTDVHDGRLLLAERAVILARPVRVRLAAWLDHRARRWPESINPHLFVNRRTAPRLSPVGHQYPWLAAGVRPQVLREDRILSEIHASGGDVRRICDLFGLTVAGAARYAATVSHPDLDPCPDPGTDADDGEDAGW